MYLHSMQSCPYSNQDGFFAFLNTALIAMNKRHEMISIENLQNISWNWFTYFHDLFGLRLEVSKRFGQFWFDYENMEICSSGEEKNFAKNNWNNEASSQ